MTMGYRDYYRPTFSYSSCSNAVKCLVIINIAVYFLQKILEVRSPWWCILFGCDIHFRLLLLVADAHYRPGHLVLQSCSSGRNCQAGAKHQPTTSTPLSGRAVPAGTAKLELRSSPPPANGCDRLRSAAGNSPSTGSGAAPAQSRRPGALHSDE